MLGAALALAEVSLDKGLSLDVQNQEILVGRWCGLGWPSRQFQFGSPWERAKNTPL
jgi:hypothetical protein